MRTHKKKKKKGNRLINLILLLLLVILLLLIDGRFGLGGSNSFMPTSDTSTSESPTTPDDSVEARYTVRVHEELIFLDDVSIEIHALSEALNALPEGGIVILVDDLANNRLFESVEDVLKDSQVIYSIQEK